MDVVDISQTVHFQFPAAVVAGSKMLLHYNLSLLRHSDIIAVVSHKIDLSSTQNNRQKTI